MEEIGLTLQTLGALFVAYAALKVHYRVLQEHKVDDFVFREMKVEQAVGFFGVVLIISGYIILIVV